MDGETTWYAYEYDKIIKEVDSQGNASYNGYGTSLISRLSGGEKVYYLYNGHGDVTALVNTGGVVVMSYYYDAFGNVLEASGAYANSFLYSGYVYDKESELYNLNARFYDAKIARFMQEDSYLGDKNDPLSLNLYTYCHNNPIKYWDPTGHYVSPTDKANLTKDQQNAIQNATDKYNSAPAGPAGDKQRAEANAAANAIRASAGYSGGSSGNSIVVSRGSSTKTVVINDTTTVNNSGTINTVNILTGANSSIINDGKIGTVNNSGTLTSIYNSYIGRVGTINNNGYVGAITNSGTIGTINNSGAVGSIYNSYSGSIGAINNSGFVRVATNSGKLGGINNTGSVGSIDNSYGSSIGAINNTKTIGNISMGKSTSAIINNTGSISSMEIDADSTTKVNNAGTINGVYLGSIGMWFYNTEVGAIKDFQKKYTSGDYAPYEYATYTFATDVFGDGSRYFGYVAPITIYRDNIVIPPVWDNAYAISYLHTHPGLGGRPGNLDHSGMDKIIAEVFERPFYVVTADKYRPYNPQYGGDIEQILEHIGPEIGQNAKEWIDYYQNQK